MRHANTALAITVLFSHCHTSRAPLSEWAQAQRGTVHIQADLTSSLDHAVTDPHSAAPVQRSRTMIDGQVKEGVYMQSPSRARFPVFVHPDARLTAWLAMLPASWEFSTDGAEFRISVITADTQDSVLLGAVTLNPRMRDGDRAWFRQEYYLAPWSGSLVLIELAVEPGPAGDSYRDWCLWGEPVVVSPPLATPRETYEETNQLIAAETLRLDWCFTSARMLDSPDSTLLTSSLALDGLRREGLYAHPPWEVSQSVIPGSRARLVTSLGMMEPCQSQSDGVMLRIIAETQGRAPIALFEYFLCPRANSCDRGWVDVSVDLARYSGGPVRLILTTSGGPSDNLVCDSVVLALPRVISVP